MNEVLEQFAKYGVVPVVVLDDAEDALPLADALLEGGLPLAEVTFRTDAAEEIIRQMTKQHPEMLIGAGTVLSAEQANRAVSAGAKFIVSPGTNPEVVEFCLDNNIPVTPGVCTPSEVEAGLGFGLDVLKFFPAEQAGGVAFIKAISAPYRNVKFMPTGGISPANLKDYLSCPAVLACGGSWMVKGQLIKDGNFAEITRLCQEARSLVKEIRG
jgi:2-dehydro-3-deoxyphosphogluconate aldolase / (4S)-4-hydroxy-2-oxoglutarate aldolase